MVSSTYSLVKMCASALRSLNFSFRLLACRVVGHVAVSGKHLWILSDQHYADSSTSSEVY